MAKKRTGLSQTLFSGIDPYGNPESALTELPLAAIRPDPAQPRRLLPPALASGIAAGELSPPAALQKWMAMPEDQADRLRELRLLADSISRHGLINPITVRAVDESALLDFPGEVSHLIVTGERRYWAHWLLVIEGRTIAYGSEQLEAGRIAVRVSPAGISVRAHQLIENLMRTDINAIEKAQGLWALRAELSGIPWGAVESGLQEGSGARVIPGSPSSEIPGVIPGSLASGPTDAKSLDLVPWTEVAGALGISNRYRILITSVLDLTPEAQALVAAQDFSEKMIRPITQKLKPFPDLQLAALSRLAQWQADNDAGADVALKRSVEALVDELLAARARNEHRVPNAGRGISRQDRAHQLQRPISHSLRVLAAIEEADELVLLARDLARDTRYAKTLEKLYDLNERLANLLDQVYSYQDTS